MWVCDDGNACGSDPSCDAAVVGLDDSLNCAPVKDRALCGCLVLCVPPPDVKMTMNQRQYL